MGSNEKEWLAYDAETWRSQIPPGSRPGRNGRPGIDPSFTGYVDQAIQESPRLIAERWQRPAFLETDRDIRTLQRGESMVPTHLTPEQDKRWLEDHDAVIAYDHWDDREARRVSLAATFHKNGVQATYVREDTVRFEPDPGPGAVPLNGLAERWISESFTTSRIPVEPLHLPRRVNRVQRPRSGHASRSSRRSPRATQSSAPVTHSRQPVEPRVVEGERIEYWKQEVKAGHRGSQLYWETVDKGHVNGLARPGGHKDWDRKESGSMTT
jgi:hypothetical protein